MGNVLMKYMARNHQGKGNAYIAALYGHTLYPDEAQYYGKIDFYLVDHSVSSRVRKLQMIYDGGCRVFLEYPHTARPNIIDDIYVPWPNMTAQFVAAAGHVEILRRYGNTKDIHVAGWSLCPIREFVPHKLKNVLFAPIHPRNVDMDKNVNRAAFDILYKLAQKGIINLSVRYVGNYDDCGLHKVDDKRVKYIQGSLDLSYTDMDVADLVISHQTYAWLAVARGIPCVMMAEDMPMHSVPRTGDPLLAKHWDDYKELLMFPLDILNTDDPLTLLQRAVETDADILDWKRRMIGDPFDADRFIEIVKGYI